ERPERIRLRSPAERGARPCGSQGLHKDSYALRCERTRSETLPGGKRDQTISQQVLLCFHYARQDRRDLPRLRDRVRLTAKDLEPVRQRRHDSRSDAHRLDHHLRQLAGPESLGVLPVLCLFALHSLDDRSRSGVAIPETLYMTL